MQRSNQRACTRIDRVCEQRREPGGVWRGRKQGDWARKRDRGSQPIRLSFPFSLSFIYIYIFSFLSSPRSGPESFIFYFQKSWRCSFFWLVKNSSNWRVTKRGLGFFGGRGGGEGGGGGGQGTGDPTKARNPPPMSHDIPPGILSPPRSRPFFLPPLVSRKNTSPTRNFPTEGILLFQKTIPWNRVRSNSRWNLEIILYIYI